MHRYSSLLFLLCLTLGAACNTDGTKNKHENTFETDTEQKSLQQTNTESGNTQSAMEPDTLYRISGTEPFWGLLVAKPQIIFTSMGGDTLKFPYREPRQASGRPKGYVQVFDLDQQQKLILRQGNQCPCSDGMSDREYPYHAILVLNEKILEGCGRTP